LIINAVQSQLLAHLRRSGRCEVREFSRLAGVANKKARKRSLIPASGV